MIRKFIKNFIFLLLALFVALELIIRVFHLYNDVPLRQTDRFGIEKWQSFQTGNYYTGVKKEVVSEYRINNFGYNSVLDYEFKPSDKTKIGLFGDSYIEGFNVNVQQSIGVKIMDSLPMEVYEFGYSGYDLVDILYLVQCYQDSFEQLDRYYISINSSDFNRSVFQPTSNSLRQNKYLSFVYRNIKLLMFIKRQGFLKRKKIKSKSTNEVRTAYQFDNFKSINQNFNIDYDKVVFIYDSQNLDADLCNYLELNYSCIDFGKTNKQEDMSFGFDKHWNDYGRSVIANLIIENHQRN